MEDKEQKELEQKVQEVAFEEEKKTANKLCLISLICMVLPIVLTIFSIVVLALTTSSDSSEADAIVFNILSAVNGAAVIAAIVLMIYVRIKYPKNIFGKVLMWLYIVIAILIVVAVIVLIVTCLVTCQSCMEQCGNMG
ncbi:MAG: hypothetical protein Q4D51_02815 [Eubacteriales bacterium]|nr:hypothetical protein [Eubacteriales bacterium]